MTDPKSEPSERILPKGEVMARGVINGLPVELIRYTEAEIRARDRQWQYEVDRERDTARSQRCHRMNLELDLRRLLDGEPTICDFEIVEELRAALTPTPAQPEPPTAAGVEPAAWLSHHPRCDPPLSVGFEPEDERVDCFGDRWTNTPLYATPPTLTDAQWPIRGVRVEGDTVIVSVKGGNEAARRLCGELLAVRAAAAGGA